MREGGEALLRVRDLDEPHELERPLLGRARPHVEVRAQRLDDLVAHGVDRVEGGHRLLEDDRDVVAADLAHLRLRHPDELAAAELRGPGGPPVGREQADERHRRLRLARTGLADDREDLAGADVVADVLRGGEPFAAHPEADPEVAHREHGRIGRDCVCGVQHVIPPSGAGPAWRRSGSSGRLRGGRRPPGPATRASPPGPSGADWGSSSGGGRSHRAGRRR